MGSAIRYVTSDSAIETAPASLEPWNLLRRLEMPPAGAGAPLITGRRAQRRLGGTVGVLERTLRAVNL